MDLYVEWQRPLSLLDGSEQRLIYTCDLAKLPLEAGVYVFARRYGKQMEALYVGKALSLRSRVRRQFNNLPLMKHVENARNGYRVLIIGLFRPRPGQRPEPCLALIERALHVPGA